MMSFMALGINYRSASVGIREHFALSEEVTIDLLRELRQTVGVQEALLLSTCNRTELYLWAPPIRALWAWLQKYPQMALIQRGGKQWYQYTNGKGMRHLMRVACGLDSMALGEVEILGQLKYAFSLAKKSGGIGKHLERLLQQVFFVAKQIRTQTKINTNSISLAHIGAQLAGRIFKKLSKKTVLLVGAGDTIGLCAKHLNRLGVEHFILANRTMAHATKLGIQLSGKIQYINLSEIPTALKKVDILVSATASPLPIIGKGMVERTIKARKQKSLLILDFALPRDVEPEVACLKEVYLYDIDDLKNVVDQNQALREAAAREAECLIQAAFDRFLTWLKLQKTVPAICELRTHYHQIEENMVQSALQAIKAGQQAELVVEKLAKKLTNKFLHKPTVFLKESALQADHGKLKAFSDLFESESC